MQVIIATTENIKVYEWNVDQLTLPTENGTVTLSIQPLPSILKLLPGVIELSSNGKQQFALSISKGIALVNPNGVRITTSIATEKPLAKLVELSGNQQLLELKLQKVKKFWSVEEISQLISELEKVKADIRLAKMKV